MSDLLEVTESNWDVEVLKSGLPVLVDFWATWCQPCLRLAPTVEAIAGEYAGRLKVVKCNTEAAGDLTSRYGVMGLPALLLFKRGRVVEQVMGAQPKQRITEKLDNHLQ